MHGSGGRGLACSGVTLPPDPSVCSPLQVLRRFLSVLGSFDWDHYCLALQGPLPLAELHNPHGEGGDDRALRALAGVQSVPPGP